MKKKCKSKVPILEDGTQAQKQIAPPPCPCELDANGDCPCDPNKPIIEGAKSNISNMLGFAGNTLFGASMTGQPDPAMGAIGGAISGLTTNGGWGALLGAIEGFAATGQARSDYEKLEQAKRDRYMKDRTFMPGQYEDGGVPEFEEIQTELGEALVLPSMEISNVKSKEKHKDMDEGHVTEAVAPGTVIFSEKKEIDLKKYADIELAKALSYYDDNDTYNFKGLKVGDVLGKTGKISFADALKKVKNFYPTSNQKEHIAEQTNQLNLAARQKVVELLFRVQSGMSPKELESGTPPKAAGGWPDYKEMLRQLGLLSEKDEQLKPGQTSFNSIPQNTIAGSNRFNVPGNKGQMSTPESYPLDVEGANYKQQLLEKADVLAKQQGWTDAEKQDYINNYAPFTAGKDYTDRTGYEPTKPAQTQGGKFNPYETVMDQNQVTVPTTDPGTGQAQTGKYSPYGTLLDPNQTSALTTDPYGPQDPALTLPDKRQTAPDATEQQPQGADNTLDDMIEKFRAKYNAQRKDLNNRYATDQNEIKTLIRRKNTNNAYQLANQALFTGLQSGYTDPALESTSLIEEQYRDVPAAVIEQQANAIASNTNSVVHALAAAGVSPGEIANYAAKSTEAVSNAQGDLRGRANDMSFQNNRNKIKEYRDVIQSNNQRMADAGAKLQAFNNKKLASFGEYLNAYLDNKDSIYDTEYRLTNQNEADYYNATAALDKGEAQLDSAKATFGINNPGGQVPKTKEELLKIINSLSPEEKAALLKQLA